MEGYPLRPGVSALNPVIIQYTRTSTAASCADFKSADSADLRRKEICGIREICG